ncbi:MAG: transporter [Rhizobacter sp.]|nr:transporter [Rhizobacter sp.]
MSQAELPVAVEAKDLTIAYGRHVAVHRVSLSLAAGSLTAIVGPNGAGKSSLLSALAGRSRPAAGHILRPAGRPRLAYLPQQSAIDRSFPVRVMDVVMLGHWSVLGAFGGANAAMRRQALDALATVGLHGFENRLIGELSVGQFQRVLFARLVLQDAAVILLDEPFSGIDARTTAELLALVHAWHGQARTVVAVLHDLDQVRAQFPQTLLLAREAIAFGDTETVLSTENLLHARETAEHWDTPAGVNTSGASGAAGFASPLDGERAPSFFKRAA